jgi:uncharacterized membrane protein
MQIELSYWPGLWKLAGACLALGALVLISYYRARGQARKPWRVTLATLRWVILAAVIGCLLGPEWVEPIKRQQNARVAVLLDSSRSMGLKDLPEERLAGARNWLKQELGPSVPEDFTVSYYSFGESLEALSSVDSVKPTADSTALADALANLLAVPSNDPLTGVVLCSDGIQTGGADPETIARTYRRKGIPIHTMTVGTTNDVRDVIVENVQVRRAVPNEAPTQVKVTLRAPGYVQQTVPVQILQEGRVVAVKDIRLTGGEQEVQLDFTPRQKGFQAYEARVPAQSGEWLSSNNRRVFGMEVIDPTIRVLYMEGTPQQPNSPIPEWKYLKRALESDPHMKVKVLYREFGANGKRLNTASIDEETNERIYPVEHPTQGFPRTLTELLEYDVVIHSDIRKESFSSEQLQNIQRLVEQFGGGFVMIGGNSAFGKGGYHRTILDRIIPTAMRQEDDSHARPFRLHVPSEAWSHPIIALGRSRAETELIWNKKLPLLYGYNLVERAKPGAVILGDDPTAPTRSGARLVLAVQSIGRGRSMAFTSDTTRTWGKDFETLWGEKIQPGLPLTEENCDGRYYRQFWVNAVRWLAAARIASSNQFVTLELGRSHTAPGEKVRAAVKVFDKELREITGADVHLTTSTSGKTNLLAKATFDHATRSYTAEFALPSSGEFVIGANAAAKGVKLGQDRQLLVCEESDRELLDPRARPELMASIARISGGQSLSLRANDSPLVNSVFYKAQAATVEYERKPLWDNPWWLAAILGLLSMEWALRRANGLA